MADHVAVGEVAAQGFVLATLQGGDHRVGNFGSLHPRALFERHDVTGDFQPGFAVKLVGAVAVPEVGDVTEFLRFRAGELGDAALGEPFTGGVENGRGIDQETLGQFQVAVVLQHPGVGDFRQAHAVELVERRFFKGAGDFDGAVATEIVENHGITVLDGADRFAVPGDDERRQILIDHTGLLQAQRLDGFRGAGKQIALAEHVGLPALFDHAPVGVVAIHGDVHAPATGGDLRVKIPATEAGEEGFERLDVIQRAGFRNVAAIEQGVHAHGLDPFFLGANDHCLEVVEVAVHVAVGEEADEVDDPAPGLGPGDDFLPRRALPDAACGDGIGDQRRALAIDLAGADGVVADFGIAHVVIGGHADGGAVGAQADVRILGEEPVERRFAGGGDGAADVRFWQPVTIHDDGDDRALDAGERSEFFQHGVFLLGET